MNRAWRRWGFPLLRGLLEAALVAWIAGYLWVRRGELGELLAIGPGTVAALVALVGATMLVRAVSFRLLVDRLGARIGIGEAVALTTATTLVNHVPMSAGLVLRGAVLHRHHDLSVPRYVALMGASGLLTVAASGGLGLGATLASASTLPSTTLAGLVALFAGVAVAPLVLLHLPPAWLAGGGAVRSRMRAVVEGWRDVRADRGTLAALAGLALLQLALVATRFTLCFGAGGVQAGWLAAAVFASVATLSVLASVTPGGLGLREVLVAALAAPFGLGFQQGMVAASLDRAVLLAFSVLAGGAGLLWLRRRGLLEWGTT